MKEHNYTTRVDWSGNDGEGTRSYRSYRRDHTIRVEGRPDLLASSDPAFRGDPTRYNPELLLVASLSSCHMLWYLHLCSAAQIVVVAYEDCAMGVMEERADGRGLFSRVVLRPRVTLSAASDRAKAHELHEAAHQFCFIANSVNFPVQIEPQFVEAGA